jgi:A/G-specific adenine glycosylase
VVVPGPDLSGAAGALLAWSAATRRDLPWRRTRDPWAVLVSELMLQQTQVARVVPRWHAFLERFPTVAACAAAPRAEVVTAWKGLGYNARAVRLHAAATVVARDLGGVLPATLEGLRALPGIGPYTARAVLAFSAGADVGVVDVNAARVHARLAGRPLRSREVQAIADAAVPPGEGWAWNQAVLDLGATVCTARAPRCDACPVRAWCAWGAPASAAAGAGARAPDPAVGSAHTGSRQSTFEGSERQGRGRLVDALRDGPLESGAVAAAAGWPGDPERARRALATLVRDDLVSVDPDGTAHLARGDEPPYQPL